MIDQMKKRDTVVVENKSGRRHFIRAGAAFLLAGSAAVNAQEEDNLFRSDCDSQGGGGPKNPDLEGSDSDSGATADRPGCGRKKPAMTEYQEEGHKKVVVGKIIA